MSLNKSHKTNLFLNTIKTSLSIAFPLITYPYATRILMPEGIGVIEFANSIVSYFVVFAGLGISVYGLREVSKLRDDKIKLSRRVHELFFLNLISSLVVTTIYMLYVFFSDKTSSKEVFLLMGITIVFTNIGLDWVYQGFEDYLYITLRNFVFQLISMVLLFLFIKEQSDLLKYVGILVFSSVAPNIVNLISVRKYIEFKNLKGYQIFIHFKKVFVIFITLFTGTLLLKLESVLLGYLLGYHEVGIYAVANKIITLLVGIITSIGMTFLPTLISKINSGKTEDARSLLNKSVSFVFFITIPLMAGLFIFSKEVILLISGKDFMASALPFTIMLPIIFLTGLSVIYGNQVFLAFHQEKKSFIILIICAPIGTLLNLLLIPIYAEAGAATAILIGSVLSCIMQCAFAMQYLKISIFTFQNLRPIAISVLMGGATLLLKRILPHSYPYVFAISGFGALFYFSLMRFLKDPFTIEIENTLIKLKNKLTS
jgi:O-antigen/teichoic acid export membrane protein